MAIDQFPLPESQTEVVPHRQQILMLLLNVDPMNPDVRFVPERRARHGWNPFDIDLSTVTGDKTEPVSVRVVILQDGLAFMTGDTDVTAGCRYSEKHLRRVSPCSSKPVKDVEFFVNRPEPGSADLEFNLGLIASGTSQDRNGKPVRWSLPIVIDPKIRNL